MNNLDLENILTEVKNLKNLPNETLMGHLDFLSKEFDITKNNIIQLTYHLDKVEELYNTIVKELDIRK